MDDIATGKQFAVATPIYYVNDVPHIGSAYTTIAADVIARYHRLQGQAALMVTGTDEHGQKIQRTAESLNRSPQGFCDEIAASFQALWGKLDIQFDRFIRTTSPRHEAIVKEFFSAFGTMATSTRVISRAGTASRAKNLKKNASFCRTNAARCIPIGRWSGATSKTTFSGCPNTKRS